MNTVKRETTPLISIGMPVYNCEKYIKLAVYSIINQSYQNWELIIIDDGSNDKTFDILLSISDTRIKLIKDQENVGLAARLNQCIDLSKGNYFARMDGDDIAHPKRLENQLEFLKRNVEIDLVGGQTLLIDEDNNIIGRNFSKLDHLGITANPAIGFSMVHPTFLGRILWFKNNLYNPKLKKAQDKELLMRTYKSSKFANLNEVVIAYRKINRNKTELNKIYNTAFKALLRHYEKNGNYLKIIQLRIVYFVKKSINNLGINSIKSYQIIKNDYSSVSKEIIIEWKNIIKNLVDN